MMKPELRCIFHWLILLSGVAASDLSLLTSSLFEITLIPTPTALQSSAAVKLQIAMRSSLFQSTSVTSTFDDVFDIDIVLQKMQWAEEEETTSVQFQVHVTFYQESETVSLPSRYSLDNLIARTFSQPSTKSGFIVQLGLQKDPRLSAVEDVSIQLVIPSDDFEAAGFKSEESQTFSTLDAVLITTSSAIFVGILCIVYVQHRARERFDESFLDLDTRKMRRSKSQEIDLEQSPQDAELMDITPKVDETASMDSDGHFSKEGEKKEQEVTKTDDSTGPPETKEAQKVAARANMQISPPVSPEASVPSSPSEVSPTTRCSSTPSSPLPSSHAMAYLLGVPTPSPFPTKKSPDHSPLTARLLRLPSVNSGSESKHKKSSRSFASAPANLYATSPSSVASTPSRDGARSVWSVRSVRSVRSLRSIRSAVGLYDVVEYPSMETSSTRSSSNLTDLAVITEQNILLAASEDFENNWKISEKMAEDDDDDNSANDLFHVDVDQHSSLEDNQSRMSGLSAVSDWMKSIRVVGGSVDSRTSEMSKSSAEHSSVEPRSIQGKDLGSLDQLSLEQSLATSLVDI